MKRLKSTTTLDIPNLLLKHISLLIQNNKKFYDYIVNGFKFELDSQNLILIITYKNKKYKVNIIKKGEQFYWKLMPYNKSSFITNIDNGLEMVLFAIKENDELYTKHEI